MGQTPPESSDLAGLVLAGGRSRRFGAEKAVALFNDVPMLGLATGLLAASCDTVLINARAGSAAAQWAADNRLPVVEDGSDDPDGPLSGVKAGLIAARRAGLNWLLTLPCDTPRLPADLAARLIADLGAAPGVSAVTPGGRHPLCALWNVSLLEGLSLTLQKGHPAVRDYQDAAGMALAAFVDDADFANLNRPET